MNSDRDSVLKMIRLGKGKAPTPENYGPEGAAAPPAGMVSICPHCGGKIELVADVSGRTIVVDAEVQEFVIAYPSGYGKLKEGRMVHKCEKTGGLGHVVR